MINQATLAWEKITACETHKFRDSGLRSGYLYLEYSADSEANVLFDASGHTIALINGLPHKGDHYDFGWNLIPVRLKKGNESGQIRIDDQEVTGLNPVGVTLIINQLRMKQDVVPFLFTYNTPLKQVL